ncbi:MAG: FAD-dependent oxidoreductase [Pseudanabaena sp. ELA607]
MSAQLDNPANHSIPRDSYNQIWQDQVFPQDWQNPTPSQIYDLVVIGAGPAGLVIAAGAAGLELGLKIALIEKNALGGDCLNVGCIPSKTLLHQGQVFAAHKIKSQGIESLKVLNSAVMEKVRQVRAKISPHDSVTRFSQMGIDVFLGEATFQNSHTLKVTRHITPDSVNNLTNADSALNNQASVIHSELMPNSQISLISFKKAVIATGTRPDLPDIAGLDTVRYFTNETIFNVTTPPEQLIILGGGPIGCELAQAWQNLGTQVYLMHRGARLLPQEDPEASALVTAALMEVGVEIHCQTKIISLEAQPSAQYPNGVVLHYQDGQGQQGQIFASHLLIATGRVPNLEALNLRAAQLRFSQTGHKLNLWTNDYLQTSQPHIFAAGDVVLSQRFTHAADAAARLVIKNALFAPWGLGRSKWSDLVIPHAIYTQPEIAQVGHTAASAAAAGLDFATITIPLSSTDRGQTDQIERGFVKIHHQRRKGKPLDKILGATIVADHAADMINEITFAMTHNLGLNALAQVVHPYPTLGEAIRKAADSYRRQLLTPQTRRILQWLYRLS